MQRSISHRYDISLSLVVDTEFFPFCLWNSYLHELSGFRYKSIQLFEAAFEKLGFGFQTRLDDFLLVV